LANTNGNSELRGGGTVTTIREEKISERSSNANSDKAPATPQSVGGRENSQNTRGK